MPRSKVQVETQSVARWLCNGSSIFIVDGPRLERADGEHDPVLVMCASESFVELL